MKSETEKMFFTSHKSCVAHAGHLALSSPTFSGMVSHIAKNCTSIVRYMDLYSVVSILMSSKQPKFV